ncbi:MAG TPA: hypothetical protein VLM38_23340 [Blastocatellia bacterium]|nr:hypothetical protein [Blastocatellia bacterium]
MKRKSVIVFLALASSVVVAVRATAPVDISGTWQFSVDLDNGGHGDPTFVFKQDKETLTGSYDGPLGQYNITGTVKENKALFGFEFTNADQKRKATYTGTIESATKMSGTLQFTDGPTGKWTATKKG